MTAVRGVRVINAPMPITPTYYFSSAGDDINDGLSSNTPKKSISALNSIVLSPGDVIGFKCGEIFKGSISITANGTSNDPIIFTHYGEGEKPILIGSEEITGWTLHSGNIYKATFATNINQLFINNVRVQEARYPEIGYANVDAAPTTSSLTCNALNDAINFSGASCLIHSSSYGLDKRTVISSVGKTLTLNSAPFSDVNTNEKFILVGKLEFLTKAGQWYYDVATSTVYLWTPNGDSPENYTITGSVINDGITISNSSYVHVKNINITQYKSRGIFISNCNNITIEENTVSNQDDKGIFSQYTNSNLFVNKNIVRNTNHMGIELFTSNSTIQENYVYDIALPDTLGSSGIGSWYMGSAIYSEGVNNLITKNNVNETGYNGIHFAGGIHTVSKNCVTNCGRVKNDGGHIYTSANVNFGNETNKGSLITQNIVAFGYGIGTTPYWEGIYLDESSGGVTVEHNTSAHMTGAGIFAHRGNNHLIQHNKVYDCKVGLNTKWDGRGTQFIHNLVYSVGVSNRSVRYYEDTYTEVVFDFNKYINRVSSVSNFNFYINGGTDEYLPFATWKTTTGKDGNSVFEGTALSTGYTTRLLTNPSNESVTYYLNNASNIINEEDGSEINTNIIIAPYSSIIISGLNIDCVLDYIDTTAPVVTEFTIPATSSSKTVTITSLTASVEAVKYLLTETDTTPSLNNAGWNTTVPTQYVFSTSGNKTLYAWVRDAAGNISASANDSVTIVLNDANIGYQTVYATLAYANVRRTMPIVMSESGTIKSISMYHESGKTGNFIFGIYDDNANTPNNQIAVTSAAAVTSVEEWQKFDLVTPIHVNSGTRIWVAWVSSNNTPIVRNKSGTLGRKADATNTYASGMPSIFGASSLVYYDYSIYVTYTPD